MRCVALICTQGNITTTMELNRENDTLYSFSVRAFNGVANGFSLVS